MDRSAAELFYYLAVAKLQESCSQPRDTRDVILVDLADSCQRGEVDFFLHDPIGERPQAVLDLLDGQLCTFEDDCVILRVEDNSNAVSTGELLQQLSALKSCALAFPQNWFSA